MKNDAIVIYMLEQVRDLTVDKIMKIDKRGWLSRSDSVRAL